MRLHFLHYLLFALPLSFCLSIWSNSGVAQDAYCVSCVEPVRSYLCSFQTPSDPITGEVRLSRGQAGKAGQLKCAIELAKRYGHGSCSVKSRENSVCAGNDVLLVVLENGASGDIRAASPSLPGAAVDIRPDSQQQNAIPLPSYEEAGPTAPTHSEGSQKEPETLVDLTKQTVKGTGKQIQNASDAVVDATKKTGDFVKDTAKSTGNAVTGAVKNSVKCVFSLFSDC